MMKMIHGRQTRPQRRRDRRFDRGGDDFTRIGEMAKKYGVTLRTLRFYEDKGLLTPKREGTTRLYARRDVARLKLILLGRKVGFSLRDVKQMMDLYDPCGLQHQAAAADARKVGEAAGRLEKQRVAIDEAICELTQVDRHRPHDAGRAPVREGRLVLTFTAAARHIGLSVVRALLREKATRLACRGGV